MKQWRLATYLYYVSFSISSTRRQTHIITIQCIHGWKVKYSTISLLRNHVMNSYTGWKHFSNGIWTDIVRHYETAGSHLLVMLHCSSFNKDFTILWSPCYIISDSVSELNSWSASHNNWWTGTLLDLDFHYSTAGGDGGCRVSEVQAGITSPMPDHKGFKLQQLSEIHPLHL